MERNQARPKRLDSFAALTGVLRPYGVIAGSTSLLKNLMPYTATSRNVTFRVDLARPIFARREFEKMATFKTPPQWYYRDGDARGIRHEVYLFTQTAVNAETVLGRHNCDASNVRRK